MHNNLFYVLSESQSAITYELIKFLIQVNSPENGNHKNFFRLYSFINTAKTNERKTMPRKQHRKFLCFFF